MRRFLGVLLVLSLPFGLFGCGDDKDDQADSERQRVADAASAIEAARTGVAHQVADGLDWEFTGGQRTWTDCSGGTYGGPGVKIQEVLTFAPSGYDDASAKEAAGIVGDDGWEVEPAGQGLVVTGTKGVVRVQVSGGASLNQVVIDVDCIETSTDLAQELGGQPGEEIEW